MNMNNKVSVIIPVYNVHRYIERCVKSVIDQTYRNIEIILVDDGSTDNSGRICDFLQKKDSRVKVYHKNNGGLSDARNYGIIKSNGDYIFFLDSDDYISMELIELLLYSSIYHKTDLVISGLHDFYEGELIRSDDIKKNKDFIISKEECYRKMFTQDQIDVNATAKLYKRQLFNDIQFPVGLPYEDIQIVDKIVEKCRSISVITYRGYYYLQRPDSIMYSSMSKDKLILIDKTEELLNFIKSKYPNLEIYALRRYIYCNFHLLGRSIINDQFIDISRQLRKNILKHKKIILTSSIFSNKEKIATVILFIGLQIYKKIWSVILLKSKRKIVSIVF